MLTPAGIGAFPGLSNADITAGPCHNHFEGSLGSLVVLALDGATPPRNFIIGGGAGTVISRKRQTFRHSPVGCSLFSDS